MPLMASVLPNQARSPSVRIFSLTRWGGGSTGRINSSPFRVRLAPTTDGDWIVVLIAIALARP